MAHLAFLFLVCSLVSVNGRSPLRPRWVDHKNAASSLRLDLTSSMVAPLTGPGLTNFQGGGYWDGDLGVPFVISNRMYFMEGDILHEDVTRLSSAIGYNLTSMATSSFKVLWGDSSNGLPVPFSPLLGQSTVPAGSYYSTTMGAAYCFMMNVIDWGTGAPGTVHANGLLLKSVYDQHSSNFWPAFNWNPVWQAAIDVPMVNAAPIVVQNGSDTRVYMYNTALYRASPVYLAYVEANQVDNFGAYQYYTGMKGTTPQWSSNSKSASALFTDHRNVGEISVVYSSYLSAYLLAFFSYDLTGTSLYFRKSSTPWGPWSNTVTVWNGDTVQAWFQAGWGGPYGGYVLPGFSTANLYGETTAATDKYAYWTLSLWVPYRVFLMKVDLSPMLNLTSTVPVTLHVELE